MGWLLVLLDLVALGGWLRCAMALVGRPASRFSHGWASKVFWLVVAVTGTSFWHGLVLPMGAALVWWRVVLRGRDPFELPMADGRRMR